MRNFNMAIIEGRLTRDPEMLYTQKGTALCKFSVANNSSFYREDELQEEVNFIEVTTWSKLAEQCNEYLKKGRRVIINGRIKQNKWEDNDGNSHSRLIIIGNQVHFLDTKKDLEDKMEKDLSNKEMF